MALKSIVVVACGDASDAESIDAAGTLAKRFSADVSVVPAFPDPAADLVYYGAALQTVAEAGERILASERAAQERLESLGRDAATRHGITIGVEKRSLMPAVALAPAATLAPLFAEALLSTRAPVLLSKGTAFSGGPIAIAWDGSTQAARAIRAAMPLLQAAKGVLVLRNVDDESEEADVSGPEQMRKYL